MPGLMYLLLAAPAVPAATGFPPSDRRWTTECPATRRGQRPSCVTRFALPEVGVAVRAGGRKTLLEVAVDARDPFTGERCEWWRSVALPELATTDDPAAVARRINQRITLLTYECNPARIPQFDRKDGEHLIRFLAETRAALANGKNR